MKIRQATKFRKTYPLDIFGIDQFIDELEAEMVQLDIERQNRLRIRLSLEESLLRFRDRFGDEEVFEAAIIRNFGHPSIQITLVQDVFNPLSKEESDFNDWSGSVLISAGLSPQFSYSKGVNVLRIVLPAKRLNPVLKIAIAIAAGILTGVIIAAILADGPQMHAAEYFFQPLFHAWNRILLAVSGPVIFFMVASTLLNMRSISEQGGDSRIVVMRYFLFSLVAGVAATVLAQIVFMPDVKGEEMSGVKASSIFESFLNNIIPENVVAPLSEANTPQILVMAFVLGTALLVIGERAKPLITLTTQCNLVGMLLAEWISRLVPYVVAVLICYQILNGHTRLLIGVWKPFLLALLASAVCLTISLLIVSARKGVSVKVLIRKVRAPFIKTIRYGSLDASYGLAVQACSKMGIERRFTNVAMPQGLVLYMPVNVIGTLIFTMYAADHFNVTVTPIWFGAAIILAIVLFVATPPVPGANLLAYIAIFAQLGIGSDALIDAMIFDIVFGIFASAGNQLLLQMELLHQSDKLGFLNKALLRKDF